MSTHQIHVFISHSWSYSGHYQTLADWIFKQSWRIGQASLYLHDYSVPKTDPILNASNDRVSAQPCWSTDWSESVMRTA